MLEDMMPEGKLAVPGVNNLMEDATVGSALQKYMEEAFGFGASYVTDELGKATAKTLFVKVSADTPDSDRTVDWYVVVNYPALAGGASCFIPLPSGSESTGSTVRSTPDTPTRF
jgi:hypothetical protein